MLLLVGIFSLTSAVFYEKDHWQYSKKLTVENFDDFIKTEVDDGKTVFVRWIMHPTKCGGCKVQAPAWNAAIKKYANNGLVSFGDVDLSMENIRGVHTPGWGGWPTIRYFNKETGYDGASYKPRTELELFDELGKSEYMDEFIEDVAKIPSCRVDAPSYCTQQELNYIDENKDLDLEELWFLMSKLEGPHNALVKLDPRKRKWHKQRHNIMKQLIVAAQAKDLEMYPRKKAPEEL